MLDFSRPGLHRHLAAYVAGIALMVGINLLTSPDVWWVQWPALGWGIGLASHAFGALRRGSVYNPEDEDDARATTAARQPRIALPDGTAPGDPAPAPSESDAMVERAQALLRRERASG